MHVHDGIVHQVTRSDPPDAASFAVRQPGIVRYLDLRLGAGSDAQSVGILLSCTICGAFEQALGVPPPPVASVAVERAEGAVRDECLAGVAIDDGFLARQPAVATYLAEVLDAPPLPLSVEERGRVGRALSAVIYALDVAVSGRPVPRL